MRRGRSSCVLPDLSRLPVLRAGERWTPFLPGGGTTTRSEPDQRPRRLRKTPKTT